MIGKDNGKSLYLQICEEIKESIKRQDLRPGAKLPSIREAARKKGVSTTTLENAYHQLTIEGYIRSVPKSGYYVETLENFPRREMISPDEEPAKPAPKNAQQTTDTFDAERFRKITNEIIMRDKRLFTHCENQGEHELRTAIKGHLYQTRNVSTGSANIIIAAGIQQLIMQLKPLFAKKAAVAYLSPGFSRAINTFETLDFSVFAHETIEAIIRSKPDIIYLSPSNLYPSGEVLPIKERLSLINYAIETGAVIIEDDYNHLFRYNAYQIPSIHSLSSGKNVIYVGSFSRNTMISLRLSYMVLPAAIRKRYNADRFAQSVSKIEQLAMARFISEGHYQKHLKRLSKLSRRKNETLKDILSFYQNAENYSISGLNSNMHVLFECRDKTTRMALIERTKEMNLDYRTFSEKPETILIPYSGLKTEQLEETFTNLLRNI